MADLPPESFVAISTKILSRNVARSSQDVGAPPTTNVNSMAAIAVAALLCAATAYRTWRFYASASVGPSPPPDVIPPRRPPRPVSLPSRPNNHELPPVPVGDSEYLRFPSKLLGKGAYGSVYAGINSLSGEYVAIKELHNVADTEMVSEYELMSKLAHPCIVGIRALVIDARHSVMSLVLERCEKSLLEQLSEAGPFPEARVRIVARQMLLGLECLHSQRILHRDIKPANVLVDGSGWLKLADFGVSRQTDETILQTLHLAGSPVFLSPEATSGCFSPGSDLWALGATLTQLLTNRTPWSHVSDCMVSPLNCLKYIGTIPSDPAEAAAHHPQYPANLSPEAMDFFSRLFALSPSQRSSCSDLLAHPFIMGPRGIPISIDNFATDVRRSQQR